jgi:CubicO group peptidase (beta-lactamase class C family)
MLPHRKVHRLSLQGKSMSAVYVAIILVILTVATPSLLCASYESPASDTSLSYEFLLERAISRNLIAGGVIVTGNHDGIISTAARGHLSPDPGSASLDEGTVFDLASLTKVIATAPAVMKLLDEGRIDLSDPLSRWFPEFAGAGHGEITILNLLTHTSGLRDFDISRNHSMGRAIRKAAAQKYRHCTGNRFQYADINFILLGELVRRVSGQTLDTFCRRQIYAPLGAKDTMFRPGRDCRADIAPTAGYRYGVVGDPNARRLGSVAGHAGLFSSAYDLSLFARLMLGRGMIDNKRVLSERVVTQMTSPYLCDNGQVRRGLGWDIYSPFSTVKGDFFSDASFGHTGYSGSSIWIDPQNDRFVILLTRRVNYHDPHAFNQLRRDVSTIASADLNLACGKHGLDPILELAKIRERLFQPEPVILQYAAEASRLAAQLRPGGKHQLRAHKRSAKVGRHLAKVRNLRLGHIVGVAKNEKSYKGVPGSRKRQKLPKRHSA